jgi:large subunit ribosomal protein L32
MTVRMRHTRAHTANRRSHHALVAPRLSTCECGAMHIPHRACPTCGKYNGRVVIDMVKVTEKKQARAKARTGASTK